MAYVPNTPEERQAMLRAVGAASVEELYADVPEEVRLQRPLQTGRAHCETELRRMVRSLADKNRVYEDIFLGAGAYRHYIPAVVSALAGRSEFVTAYTPYQAEMSQGILQSIFEYQTMICELTGMDVSNASVYDGASAAGEACHMVRERGRNKVLVSSMAHPQVIETMCTYARPVGMEIEIVNGAAGATDLDDLRGRLDGSVAGIYIASPNFFGVLEDIEQIAELAYEAGCKLIVGANPIACALLKPPGELGADIVVGEGQPLGLPLSYGGPYLGFMACKQPLMRRLPGRIVGQTKDTQGKRSFVLTLQAREQHIRREKAGSNICSNQAWCALTAAVYMGALGPAGMREVALACYANAHYLKDELEKIGFVPLHQREFFHEFITSCPVDKEKLRQALDKRNILGGLWLEEGMLWCATELTGKPQIDRLVRIIREVKAHG